MEKFRSLSNLGLLNSSSLSHTDTFELYAETLDSSVEQLEALYAALSKDVALVDQDRNLSDIGRAVGRRQLAVKARRLASEISEKARRKPEKNLAEARSTIPPAPLAAVEAIDVVTWHRRCAIVEALRRLDPVPRLYELKASIKNKRFEPIRAVAGIPEPFMRAELLDDAEYAECVDLFVSVSYESQELQIRMATTVLDLLASNQATADAAIRTVGAIYPDDAE